MFINLCVQLNDHIVLGQSTLIRMLQLQKKFWLNESPLVKWPFQSHHNFQDHVAELLTIIPQYGLSFAVDSTNDFSFHIEGGSTHLLNILPESLYIKSLKNIKKSHTMFIEQLISLDGIYLLKWQDRKTYFDDMKLNKPPKWFNELSNLMIKNPSTSRRIKRQWRLSPQVPDFNSAIFFNHGFQFNSWTCFWSSQHNSMITGKLLKSLNQDILVEHWRFVTTNDDNSPSNKKFLIQKCQGCHINDDRIIHPGYFPKGIRSACAISCPKNLALKLLNVKKHDSTTSVVGISKFHYEQLVRYHCFKRLPGSEENFDVDHNIDDRTIHQDNGANARLIRSIITNNESQVALIRASWNFNHRSRMTFYTDGSLQNVGSDTIQGGAAWMETSTTIPVCFQTSISNEWISSFKTELVALLLALLVSCEHSEVHIYTDSKSVIDKFKELAKNVDTFKYARDRLKDSHSTL